MLYNTGCCCCCCCCCCCVASAVSDASVPLAVVDVVVVVVVDVVGAGEEDGGGGGGDIVRGDTTSLRGDTMSLRGVVLLLRGDVGGEPTRDAPPPVLEFSTDERVGCGARIVSGSAKLERWPEATRRGTRPCAAAAGLHVYSQRAFDSVGELDGGATLAGDSTGDAVGELLGDSASDDTASNVSALTACASSGSSDVLEPPRLNGESIAPITGVIDAIEGAPEAGVGGEGGEFVCTPENGEMTPLLGRECWRFLRRLGDVELWMMPSAQPFCTGSWR